MGSQFSTGTIRNLIQENFDFDLRSIQNAHKCHQQTAVRSGLRLIESTFIDVRQFQNLFGFSRIKSRDIFLIFDPSQKGKIFSNDIFGGLCLASNSGDDKEKLDFLFKLTDYQTAGELNREELIMGMHSSCRGLARIKSLNHPFGCHFSLQTCEGSKLLIKFRFSITSKCVQSLQKTSRAPSRIGIHR